MAISVVGNDPVTAPEDERAALARVVELLGEQEGREVDLVGVEGTSARLPESARRILREVAEILARGEFALVASIGPEVTPNQAAELLALPERYVDRLLDEGTIPATGTGAGRRIKLLDLLAYRRVEDARRETAMLGLVRLSEQFGLYEENVPAPARHG